MCEFLERDWKLFRKRVPEWQERYMAKLVGEYAAILAGSELPSTKFWKLEKRIGRDKRRAGVCTDMRRSAMFQDLLCLLNEKAITEDDLDGFSDGLKQDLLSCLQISQRLP